MKNKLKETLDKFENICGFNENNTDMTLDKNVKLHYAYIITLINYVKILKQNKELQDLYIEIDRITDKAIEALEIKALIINEAILENRLTDDLNVIKQLDELVITIKKIKEAFLNDKQ